MGLSSTFNFTTEALAEYCSATASIAGASMRHGPHHSAQKSTRTGFSDLSTSLSKELSVTSLTSSLIFVLPLFVVDHDGRLFVISVLRFLGGHGNGQFVRAPNHRQGRLPSDSLLSQ